MSQPKVIGKNWGKGLERTKKFTFKEKPKKSLDELEEVKKLKEQYELFDSSKVKSFYDVPLSWKTRSALKDAGFTKPTEIQKESIGLALRGLDILGAAKTGSGKTLAFLIPVLEILNAKLWTKMDGLGALIITPTRELAYQIFEALRQIGKKHDYSAGLIIGGKDLKFERRRMDQMNIIICTPGRLLQHMDENPNFDCNNVQVLVLDEADRCLDMGFEQQMNDIIANLPTDRQTLLFSATQTKSIKDLARLSLKSPVYVSVHENAQFSTPETLQQSYIVCPLELKLDTLWSFLKHHKKSKILVFLSSCKQVRFIHMLFCRMRPGMSILGLYGSLHQLKRMAVYEEFCSKQACVLFATDIAARGLDFPAVDWVLQLDCPEDATTYIHRAGRTARLNKNGEALLVLLPSEEEAMIEQLQKKKIPITKIEVNNKRLVSVKRKFEALLARDVQLKECAQLAFKAYLKSTFLMKNKQVFDVSQLDLPSFASSLGLAVAPRVRFIQKRLDAKAEKSKKKSNPKVNKDANDAEQEFKIKEEPESDEEVGEHNDDDDEDTTVQLPNKPDPTYDFSVEDEEEDGCDDLFVGKKEIKLEDNAEADAAAQQFLNPTNVSKKPKSKAAVAKKLLKKKIQTNKKVVFDEEGEAVADLRRERQSDLAKSYETEDVSGIDIEKAKEILKLEDHVDKKLHRERIKAKHREQRKKEKLARKGITAEDEENAEGGEDGYGPDGSQEKDVRLGSSADQDYGSEDDDDDGGSEPDLSWLPNPDKVYGPEGDNENMSEDEDGDEDEDEDQKFSQLLQSTNKSKNLRNKRKAPMHEQDDGSDSDEYRGMVVNTSDESESDSGHALKALLKSSKSKPSKKSTESDKKSKKKAKKQKKQKIQASDSDEDNYDMDSELNGLDANLMEELALKLIK